MSLSRVAPWRGMMRQTLTIADASTMDAFANLTFGSPTTYRCRLVGKTKLVRNSEGREVVSSQHAILASGVMVLPNAQVTLSTGDVGSTEPWAINPPIMSTARYPDETGRNVYTAVFLKNLVLPAFLFLAGVT